MGIFRRKKKQSDQPQPSRSVPTADDGPRDPDYPLLTAAQGAWVRSFARTVVAEHGREATARGAMLVLDDGSEIGLDNLVRNLATTAETDWPELVRGHLSALFGPDVTDDGPLDRTALLVKLRPAAEVPPDFLRYAPLEPLPGVLGVLAADLPTVVKEFGSLDGLGNREDTFDKALANLAALPTPEVTSTEPAGEENDVVHVLTGTDDDFFVAARVLVLSQLVRTTFGRPIPAHGMLVAVPNRDRMLLHFPTDVGVVGAINLMSSYAASAYDSAPGPISPFVFHISPDLVGTQVTFTDGDTISVKVQGGFAEMFRALGLIDD